MDPPLEEAYTPRQTDNTIIKDYTLDETRNITVMTSLHNF